MTQANDRSRPDPSGPATRPSTDADDGSRRDSSGSPIRPMADTGDGSIDSALEDFAAAESKPVAEHVEAAESLDRALRSRLTSTAEG